VNNKLFKESYAYILEEIKPDENHERGILCTVIYSILDQLEAEELCQAYGINKKSNLDEDWLFTNDIINTVFIDKLAGVNSLETIPQIAGPIKDILRDQFNKIVSMEEEKMEWIVIAGIMLIGVYFSRKNLSKKEKPLQFKPPESPPLPPKTAALCLVVSASEVSNIKTNSVIIRNDIERLIDAASYFLCVETEELNLKENHLELLTDKPIPLDGEQEVYMRIDIDNGQEIISKKNPYFLKRDLPPEAKGIIQELAVLGSLKGLETFNRI
jgi:hypothetical protein